MDQIAVRGLVDHRVVSADDLVTRAADTVDVARATACERRDLLMPWEIMLDHLVTTDFVHDALTAEPTVIRCVCPHRRKLVLALVDRERLPRRTVKTRQLTRGICPDIRCAGPVHACCRNAGV